MALAYVETKVWLVYGLR